MIPTRETEADPICPHCEATLREIWYRKLTTTLGVRYVYLCASCRKALGFSHRKGFWMG